MKTNVSTKGSNKPVRAKKIKSEGDVSATRRKLLEKPNNIRKEEGVDPTASSISLLSFLPLFSVYGELREYFVREVRGRTGFSSDYFVLFMCIACGVSVVHRDKRIGRGGVSVSYLVGVLYNSVNSSLLRAVNYKLGVMRDAGLITRVVSVSGIKCYRYSISIHAEKLLLDKIGKGELLSLNRLVKSLIR